MRVAMALLAAGASGLLNKKTGLDINQVASIEGQPVVGGAAGEGGLGQCQALAKVFVDNPDRPHVKVCGTQIKLTMFLAARCGEGSSGSYLNKHTWEVGVCDTSQSSTACEEYSPAQDPRMGHAQSYKVEVCATSAAR